MQGNVAMAATSIARVNGVETETNPSKIRPLDMRVLVLPDPVEKKTAGGIILIEPEVEKAQFAQCKATLIAVGENAWEEAASRSSAFVKPGPGARVLIAKYGGILIKGADGEEYRMMNDEDVLAWLEE